MTDESHGKVDRRTALLTGVGVAGALAGFGLLQSDVEAAPTRASRLRMPAAKLPDKAMDKAMRAQGQEAKGGVYTSSLGREDLQVKVEGIDIHPDFGLAADIFFLAMGNSAMVMGELPLRDSEVNGTISRVQAAGFQVTGVHNHRIMMSPRVMWLHFMGEGDPVRVAAATRGVFPPQGKFSSGGSQPKTSPLPADQLGKILGGDAQISEGGVVQVSVDRSDTIRMNGMVVPPAFGVNSQIYFQSLGGGRAAIEGEFALKANEVTAVGKRVRASGMQITALHNHHLFDQPHLFFMHTWAVGDALTLAREQRAALDYSLAKRPNSGVGKG